MNVPGLKSQTLLINSRLPKDISKEFFLCLKRTKTEGGREEYVERITYKYFILEMWFFNKIHRYPQWRNPSVSRFSNPAFFCYVHMCVCVYILVCVCVCFKGGISSLKSKKRNRKKIRAILLIVFFLLFPW